MKKPIIAQKYLLRIFLKRLLRTERIYNKDNRNIKFRGFPIKNYVMMAYLALISLSYAENDPQQIQDTKAALKYFEEELNFTANPSTLKKITEGKLDGVIIDLRKKEDFEREHISGSINIPFDQYEGFEGKHTEFPGLSKNKINYVYCYELLCNLSLKAAKKFASLGYPVKEVKGGFKAWAEHNYPIERHCGDEKKEKSSESSNTSSKR